MHFSSFKALSLASLLAVAQCAPAPRGAAGVRRRQTEGNGGRVGGNDGNVVADTPVGPPGASGQLRGPASLGGFSPSNPIDSPDTAIPADQYQLAPGQEADEDLGFYLDFSNIDNPQPIRGDPGNAPTDPGPSMSLVPV